MSQLSKGSIKSLQTAEPNNPEPFDNEYTLQVLAVKNIGNNAITPSSASPERYRIMISDGVHYTAAILATQLNGMVHDNSIARNTVAVIDKMACNYIRERRLLVILSLRVIEHTTDKIGDPRQFEFNDGTNNSTVILNAVSTSSRISTFEPSVISESSSVGRTATQLYSPEIPVIHGNLYPIECLTPYQNDWTIKACVRRKSEIKTFSNTHGEGQLFDTILTDESGEIRGTCFNLAVDDLYHRLEEGKTYFISRARVNLARKKFSNLNNDYELCFDQSTKIQECQETNDPPSIKYTFIPLNAIENLTKDAVCDVIGIVQETMPLSEILSSKQNRQIAKRELILVDKSGFSIRLTLWGQTAKRYNVNEAYPVVACKGVKVGDFGGRCLSTFSSSTVQINPAIQEAGALREWYDTLDAKRIFKTYSQNGERSSSYTFDIIKACSLNDIRLTEYGMPDKPSIFSSSSPETCGYVKSAIGALNHQTVVQRYAMSMIVSDYSGQIWLQGFNDVGLVVFGMTANELLEIKKSNTAEYASVMLKANYKTFNFLCRARLNTYTDKTRINYGISRVQSLDYKKEAKAICNVLYSTWAK